MIPVRDGGHDFERCLRGVRSNQGVEFELVVVDDGSDDGSGAIAERHGARVIRHHEALGPAAARNTGAEAARGSVIFFLDADVVPHADCFARALGRFAADPGLSALFGSYDDAPSAAGLVSRYRNLLHHFVHQQGAFVDDARPVGTFWTGLGAIRREAFVRVGGFDPALYRRPAIEDIELGYRLGRSGGRIALCRDIQATHLKRWTLRSIVRTDILCRGVPWTLLMLRSRRVERDLNVSRSQRASVAALGASIAALPALPFAPSAGPVVAALLTAVAFLNRDFYTFLARKRGLAFALGAFPLHLLYFVCCGVSVAIALAINALPAAKKARAEERWLRAEAGSPAVPAPKTAPAPSRSPGEMSWKPRR